MNNVFVYCELEGTTVADVSLELLTKGRKLANQLGCQLEAIVAGNDLKGVEKQVFPYGVDKLHVLMLRDCLHTPHCLMLPSSSTSSKKRIRKFA